MQTYQPTRLKCHLSTWTELDVLLECIIGIKWNQQIVYSRENLKKKKAQKIKTHRIQFNKQKKKMQFRSSLVSSMLAHKGDCELIPSLQCEPLDFILPLKVVSTLLEWLLALCPLSSTAAVLTGILWVLIIWSNSSLICLYFSSVRGVRARADSSSGLSLPLFSFLLNAWRP